MRIALIVAVADNGVIGRGDELPWRLSADLKRFRALTTGHHVLMGRRTFESIGRPLPERVNVVITRSADWSCDGVVRAGSLDEAIEIARSAGETEAFVIGGAQIYALALPEADRLYLTRVHATVEGDVLFPVFDEAGWEVVEESAHAADDRNEHATTFRVLDRAARSGQSSHHPIIPSSHPSSI